MAREVWECSAIWSCMTNFKGGNFSTLCLFVASRAKKDDLEIFCMLAWGIWLNRNKILFETLVGPPLRLLSGRAPAGRVLILSAD